MPAARPTSHPTLPSYRFLVEINSQVEAVFSECSGLSVEVEVKEYEEGGQNMYVHKFPGRLKWTNITLKKGMTDSLALWDWHKETVAGTMNRKNLSIILMNEAQQEGRRWNVIGAYPVKWTGPDLKVDGNNVAIETLELAHNGFTLA